MPPKRPRSLASQTSTPRNRAGVSGLAQSTDSTPAHGVARSDAGSRRAGADKEKDAQLQRHASVLLYQISLPGSSMRMASTALREFLHSLKNERPLRSMLEGLQSHAGKLAATGNMAKASTILREVVLISSEYKLPLLSFLFDSTSNPSEHRQIMLKGLSEECAHLLQPLEGSLPVLPEGVSQSSQSIFDEYKAVVARRQRFLDSAKSRLKSEYDICSNLSRCVRSVIRSIRLQIGQQMWSYQPIREHAYVQFCPSVQPFHLPHLLPHMARPLPPIIQEIFDSSSRFRNNAESVIGEGYVARISDLFEQFARDSHGNIQPKKDNFNLCMISMVRTLMQIEMDGYGQSSLAIMRQAQVVLMMTIVPWFVWFEGSVPDSAHTDFILKICARVLCSFGADHELSNISSWTLLHAAPVIVATIVQNKVEQAQREGSQIRKTILQTDALDNGVISQLEKYKKILRSHTDAFDQSFKVGNIQPLSEWTPFEWLLTTILTLTGRNGTPVVKSAFQSEMQAIAKEESKFSAEISVQERCALMLKRAGRSSSMVHLPYHLLDCILGLIILDGHPSKHVLPCQHAYMCELFCRTVSSKVFQAKPKLKSFVGRELNTILRQPNHAAFILDAMTQRLLPLLSQVALVDQLGTEVLKQFIKARNNVTTLSFRPQPHRFAVRLFLSGMFNFDQISSFIWKGFSRFEFRAAIWGIVLGHSSGSIRLSPHRTNTGTAADWPAAKAKQLKLAANAGDCPKHFFTWSPETFSVLPFWVSQSLRAEEDLDVINNSTVISSLRPHGALGSMLSADSAADEGEEEDELAMFENVTKTLNPKTVAKELFDSMTLPHMMAGVWAACLKQDMFLPESSSASRLQGAIQYEFTKVRYYEEVCDASLFFSFHVVSRCKADGLSTHQVISSLSRVCEEFKAADPITVCLGIADSSLSNRWDIIGGLLFGHECNNSTPPRLKTLLDCMRTKVSGLQLGDALSQDGGCKTLWSRFGRIHPSRGWDPLADVLKEAGTPCWGKQSYGDTIACVPWVCNVLPAMQMVLMSAVAQKFWSMASSIAEHYCFLWLWHPCPMQFTAGMLQHASSCGAPLYCRTSIAGLAWGISGVIPLGLKQIPYDVQQKERLDIPALRSCLSRLARLCAGWPSQCNPSPATGSEGESSCEAHAVKRACVIVVNTLDIHNQNSLSELSHLDHESGMALGTVLSLCHENNVMQPVIQHAWVSLLKGPAPGLRAVLEGLVSTNDHRVALLVLASLHVSLVSISQLQPESLRRICDVLLFVNKLIQHNGGPNLHLSLQQLLWKCIVRSVSLMLSGAGVCEDDVAMLCHTSVVQDPFTNALDMAKLVVADVGQAPPSVQIESNVVVRVALGLPLVTSSLSEPMSQKFRKTLNAERGHSAAADASLGSLPTKTASNHSKLRTLGASESALTDISSKVPAEHDPIFGNLIRHQLPQPETRPQSTGAVHDQSKRPMPAQQNFPVGTHQPIVSSQNASATEFSGPAKSAQGTAWLSSGTVPGPAIESASRATQLTGSASVSSVAQYGQQRSNASGPGPHRHMMNSTGSQHGLNAEKQGLHSFHGQYAMQSTISSRGVGDQSQSNVPASGVHHMPGHGQISGMAPSQQQLYGQHGANPSQLQPHLQPFSGNSPAFSSRMPPAQNSGQSQAHASMHPQQAHTFPTSDPMRQNR